MNGTLLVLIEIFPVKMVHLQRWSSWTAGPVRPKLPVPFPKIFVFSPTLLSSNQISVETQMDRYDVIENVVSIEQCRSILF